MCVVSHNITVSLLDRDTAEAGGELEWSECTVLAMGSKTCVLQTEQPK